MNFIFLALNSAFLTIFLNYIIGKPGSEFSPYEIFSGYTVWLSIRRLKKIGLIKTYHSQFQDSFIKIKNPHEYYPLKMDYHKILYNAAEPYFTWERALGMCSVCTCFWISLITSICFSQNFVHCVSIVVISHVTIRIINKLL